MLSAEEDIRITKAYCLTCDCQIAGICGVSAKGVDFLKRISSGGAFGLFLYGRELLATSTQNLGVQAGQDCNLHLK